jgi:hypothetical protein
MKRNSEKMNFFLPKFEKDNLKEENMEDQIKKIKAKVEFKHETAADWEKSSYVPS